MLQGTFAAVAEKVFLTQGGTVLHHRGSPVTSGLTSLSEVTSAGRANKQQAHSTLLKWKELCSSCSALMSHFNDEAFSIKVKSGKIC